MLSGALTHALLRVAEWLGLCLVQDLVEEAATAAEFLEQGRVISEACDAKQDDDYCQSRSHLSRCLLTSFSHFDSDFWLWLWL